MRREVIALIIYRNRYLLTQIPDGEFAGNWEFPNGPASAKTTDFETLRKAIKAKLGVAIFPYITLKQLVYKSPDDETIELTLIKCKITDESKRFLLSNAPLKYKWISLPYVAHIDFAPRDKKIVRHLTNGLFLVPIKHTRRSARMLRPKAEGKGRQGFASMDKARLFQITSAVGKAAHAMGRAHRWTPQEASRAGRLGRGQSQSTKDRYDMSAESMRSQLLQILQASLSERPGAPVSFVAIGKALGISRQYVRKLYHELKTEYPLPPVGKRGFGANPPDKRALMASKGGTQVQALGKAHVFTSEEASLAPGK